MNHLIHEKSPYLLQHTQNPVDWYPWCKEAFEKAKREDKPVFLSIGYSTCHWCHVMAHESFEDETVAELLNRSYISIKVDREERPDIDAVYMAVCQAVTGSGGWPLTVILTPDQKPFFAGTYFPKHARYGQPGLLDILTELSRNWKTRREELLHAGQQLTSLINQNKTCQTGTWDKKMLKKAEALFLQDYDPRFGGFGQAPKFPIPHNLLFLMQYAKAENRQKPLAMAKHTLHAMAEGGIFDHIGGGFSRYSTDEAWLVPHFEKMLYDNALLAMAYLEAFQITKDVFYGQTARQTLDYMIRELTSPEGAFFCGQDADSDGVEGKYYFFTPDEIIGVLGEQAGRRFCLAYGITETGNFEGKSIPNRIHAMKSLPDEIEESRLTLYQYRRKRTRLHLDDKVILSWNAWAVTAMARAAGILREEKYLDTAKRAHAFISCNMTDDKNRLFLRWREGEMAHAGCLDDYAVYGLALLELYQATFDPAYLKEAVLRGEQMTGFFEDREMGGYYLTASDAEKLIARQKETYDGALPSGNSTAAMLLSKLFNYTGDTKWQEAAQRQNRFLAGTIKDFPYGHSFGLLALMESLYPSRELVVVSADEALPGALKDYLSQNGSFGLTVLFKSPQNAALLGDTVPFTKDYPIPKTGCMYYLCQNGMCAAPEMDFEKLDL